MAQYLTLPVENLHEVPQALSDQEACFTEPLAAACRIREQGLPAGEGARVAVIGDGKLGLLVAQALLCAGGGCQVTLFGRHAGKMALVEGLAGSVLMGGGCAATAGGSGSEEGGAAGGPGAQVAQPVPAHMSGQFDMVVEASGSSQGIRAALALCRPLGTLLLKSTVSLKDPGMPSWSEVANDVVVNEKVCRRWLLLLLLLLYCTVHLHHPVSCTAEVAVLSRCLPALPFGHTCFVAADVVGVACYTLHRCSHPGADGVTLRAI